jgi:hypothetical protein
VTPDVLAPVFFIAAGLLIAAGFAKIVRPRPTAQALSDVGWPASDGIARVVGVVEVCVGAAAMLAGGIPAAVALSVVYLVFAAFLGFVLVAHPDAGSCGCAGAKAVPPSCLHLVLNLGAATVGAAFAAVAGPGAIAWIRELGGTALIVVPGLALSAWLAVVAVTEAPTAWHAWTPPRPHEEHEHEPRDHHARAEEALASAGIGPGHPSLWPGIEPPSQEGAR